jgi:S-adenosyl-L-methionine hydrolase (adenosine-forming)
MAVYDWVTLTTDYGLSDGYAGMLHGVLAQHAPWVRVIDVTHQIPPGDVSRGAAVLAQAIRHFPPAVHVAVVDPGVGTRRRAVALAAGERVFVGPDNGVLSWAAAEPEVRAYELTNEELWRKPVSATFHGRDIFTPVAAHIAAGRDVASVGGEIDPAGLVTLPPPTRTVRDGTAEGEVVTVDRFGNVQLSLTADDLKLIGAECGGALTVLLGRHAVQVTYGETFGSVGPGELVAYTDATGRVALAVNAGNAAQRLGLPPGAHVRLTVAR